MRVRDLPSPHHLGFSVLVGGGVGVLLVILAGLSSPVAAAVVLTVGLAVVVVILRNPSIGILMTAAVVPLERFGRFTSDSSFFTISLMRLIGMLTLGSFLLHTLVKRYKFNTCAAFNAYAAYFGFSLITLFYNQDTFGNIQGSAAILGNLLFLFLIINLVRNWEMARMLVLIWLASTVLLALYTAYDWHFGGMVLSDAEIGTDTTRSGTVHEDFAEWESLESVRRALGPTSHSAVYGINLVMTLPFFVFMLHVNKRPLIQVASVLGLAVVLYNVMLSNTRAALLLAVGVMILCVLRGMVVINVQRIVVGIIGLLILLSLVPGSVYDRVLDLSNYTYEKSGSLRIRLEYWSIGFDLAEEHWLLGIGVGNETLLPTLLSKDIGTERSSVHNEYLQTFIEVGVIGWVVFFLFVALTLWYSFKAAANFRHRPEAAEQYYFSVASQVTMIAVLTYGIQVDVFHFPLKGWWLVAGLSWVMYQLSLNETDSGQGIKEFSSKNEESN
jgi:O-antigen ligase